MDGRTPSLSMRVNLLFHARANRRGDTSGGVGVRLRLLSITAVAITPIVLLTVTLALQRAVSVHNPMLSASWLLAALAPALIGIGAIAVVWAGSEYYLTRWLVYLERLADAYAKGHFAVRPSGLDAAPTEVRWLGAAIGEMANAVQSRDKALRGALEEQTLLVREIHHRVKNNLQIVGSLLSMQAAHTENIAVREALTDALVRMDAMALVQRFAEEAEEDRIVDGAALFSALAAQLQARLRRGRRRILLEFNIEACRIGLESLSPLLLIATEAVLLAYRRPAGFDARISVSLWTEGATPHLMVRADNDALAFTDARDEISVKMMDGYARQLHAQLDRTSEPGVLTLAIAPRLAA